MKNKKKEKVSYFIHLESEDHTFEISKIVHSEEERKKVISMYSNILNEILFEGELKVFKTSNTDYFPF